MISILEKNLWSHTYWCWTEDIASLPEWRLLVRAYPVAVAGRLRSYHWDGSAFEMEYDAVPGVTEIFVPGLAEREWETDIPQGNADVEAEGWNDTGHGILRITAEKAQRIRICIHLLGNIRGYSKGDTVFVPAGTW